MRVGIRIFSIVAAAGMASTAFGQDSTSKNSDAGNGLPGDALRPWVTGVNQRASYVVDMVPLWTSQNTRFGIAPVMKASKTNASFFSTLWGSQSISQTIRTGVPYWSSSYTQWAIATAGINSTENNQGAGFTTTLTPTGSVTGLAVGFRESSALPSGLFCSEIIGGLLNYDPADPSRLYVTRVVAAVDAADDVSLRSSTHGYGGVDSHGNIYLRADDFGCTAATKIVGVNLFRVRLAGAAGRNSGLLNVIEVGGGADATASDWLLKNAVSSTNQHGTPSCIPENIAGRGVLLGSNFNAQYVHEQFPYPALLTNEPSVNFQAPPATNIRGGVFYSTRDLFSAGGGTAGILAVTAATDGLSLWGIDTAGNPGAKYTFVLPAGGIGDPCEPGPAGNFVGVFDGYRSQVAAQGGNGCVAIGKDWAGRGLAAAVEYSSAVAQNPINAIAVARFDPASPTTTTEWTLAAWNDSSFTGKPIHGDYGNDGAWGFGVFADAGQGDGIIDLNPLSPTYDAPIGRLAIAPEQPGLIGPSMSSPTFDSAGNLYFLSIVALNKIDGLGNPFIDIDTALIRAIYDPCTFCYSLDLMMETGDTYLGANSATRYQVQFLDVMDSNSVSSGTIWSSNASAAAWNNMGDATYPTFRAPKDAENLGGLVIGAKVVYDVSGDGLYQDPTSSGGDPTSTDEAYNVVFYIGNMAPPPVCPADFNKDGFVDGIDYDLFNSAFESFDPATQVLADFNGDCFVDGIDYDLFNGAFETLCP